MTVEAASVWELVEQRASATPDAVMVVDERGRHLTYADLCTDAERVASALASVHGVGPGSVVSWQLPTSIEAIVVWAALTRLGAVSNPIVPALRAREVGFITEQAGSSLVIVPSTFRGFDHATMAKATGRPVLIVDDRVPTADPARLDAHQPLPPDAVRWLFATSGTTAEPKVARHGDVALVAASRSFTNALEVTAADRMTLLAPIAHIGGIAHLVTLLRTGCRAFVSATFDPERTPARLREQDITLVGSGIPFLQAYLRYQRAHSDEAPLFPHARACLSGGAPRPPGLHDEVRRELGGVGIVSGYGLTECPMLAWGSITDADHDLAVAEGRPAAGVDVRVVDGELRVRGPQLMAGYLDASLDAAAFDADGYLRTGDLGTLDARGYLTITGRLKEVIIRNMENISAREIEALVLTDPAVGDVAVIGVPDPVTGERVCAVVVPADPDRPPTLAQLCEHLRAAGLNPRKLPERLEIVAEIPRNPLGKVAGAQLRALVATSP